MYEHIHVHVQMYISAYSLPCNKISRVHGFYWNKLLAEICDEILRCSDILRKYSMYLLYCMHTYSSLEPLLENSRLDDELRQLIKKSFPEFCRQGKCTCTCMYTNVCICKCTRTVHVHCIIYMYNISTCIYPICIFLSQLFICMCI